MRLNRRSLLLLGAAATGQVLAPPALRAAPSRESARDLQTETLLREFILQRASSSTDPWLEMHVVLALGAGFDRSGRNLLDELVAQILAVETVDMRQYPYFPLDIERHPFHMLQILQATDVPYDRTFVTPHGRYTRRELVDAGTALLTPGEITDELSWVVSVLCKEFRPDADRFTTARGTKVVVEELVRRHLAEAEKAYADVFEVMERRKLYDKGPLHSTACNGTHLLYGLVEALRFGYGGTDLLPRVEKLVGATLFRARLEPVLIDRALPGDDPMMRLNRDAAKFTFVGHVVEVLGYAQRHGVLEMSEGARRASDDLRDQLSELTDRLTTGYDLETLRDDVPQAYKLILGDACHAYRGIRLWR